MNGGTPSTYYPDSLAVVDVELWRKKREEAYRRFLEDIEIGYADKDVIDLVKTIFGKKYVFSTSSCSGRITVVDALYPWLRDESYIVFKKHEPMALEELKHILNRGRPIHRLWIVVSGPIIHLNTLTVDAALKILTAVREVGFKHSGILSIGRGGVVVELVTGIWVPFLLHDGETVLIKDLDRVVNIANSILLEGKSRLEKLFKIFKELDV